ncbi:MAG: BON domain-containing protein [Fimbriimonas sp.]|nr:BON domain-containing protein [Fimbriimonas sp.]
MDTRIAGWAFIMALAVITAAGCTHSASDHYGSTRSNATDAIEDTGKGIASDPKAAGHTISEVANITSYDIDQTSARVERAILGAPDIHTCDLTVSTDDDDIVLRGRVATEVENESAEHLARAVAGPEFAVDDQLRVHSQD